MDANQQWAMDELQRLIEDSRTYNEQAFYRSLRQHFMAQSQRLDQAREELDGRSWADKLSNK